jgi:hypothetical protein
MRNIFTIPVEDVQYIAQKKIGRKLNFRELEMVQKGVEFGLECWDEVVGYAIDELVAIEAENEQSNKKDNS